MEALNYIKEKHLPYDGYIDNNIYDNENHNYKYYLDYYTNPISKLTNKHILDSEIIIMTINEIENIIFPCIFMNLRELNLIIDDIITFDFTFPNLEKIIINGQKLIISYLQPKLNYISFTAPKIINYKNDNKNDNKDNFI